MRRKGRVPPSLLVLLAHRWPVLDLALLLRICACCLHKMPLDQLTQPCEVCGVDTTSRCSSCQLAGIDFFFRSKEPRCSCVCPSYRL